MNKLTLAILTTFLLLATGNAFAQKSDGEHHRQGQHSQRGMQGAPAVQHLVHALHRLDMSDDQKASIKAIMQGLKAELGPIMSETKASHLQLQELVKADTYDEQAVAAVAEKQGQLASQRVKITSRVFSEVFNQLTAEQRSQLDTMAEKRKTRRLEAKGNKQRKHHSEEA